MAQRSSYSLRTIAEADRSNVIEFLKRTFFRDEPLLRHTGISLDYMNGKTCPELESYCANSIPEGNSVMAVSPTGKIMGVILNGAMYRDAPVEDAVYSSEKFKKISDLLKETARQTDVFSKFPDIEKLLYIKAGSVDKDYQRMGVFTALLDKTRDIAEEQDFKLIMGNCTSQQSALAHASRGDERIHVLKYSDYFQDGGSTPVFSPPPPHFAVQVYVYNFCEKR